MKFTYATAARPVDGYTIRHGIHRGGYGEVYYAVSDAGKEVALKLLTHDLDTELRGIRQCLNLKHPNLVALFDVKTDAEGEHWVVMEYVHGSNLEDVLTAFAGGMPLEEVRDWLQQIVAGVDFLHDRGLVHRDLKPANIYRENGVVKIGDVGLSKKLDGSRGQHTESIGTVYYMAPEITHGQYGPQIDVYSLGIMLYEMLTGKLPFTGETSGEILMKQLSAAPDLSLVPTHLRPVVARALHKDPKQRTPSAKQLWQEFDRATSATPIPDSHFVNGKQAAVKPPAVRPDTGKRHDTAPRPPIKPVPAPVVVNPVTVHGSLSDWSRRYTIGSIGGTLFGLLTLLVWHWVNPIPIANRPPDLVFTIATVVLGAWTLLTCQWLKASYFWPHEHPRWLHAVAGAGLGVAVYGLDQFLLIDLKHPQRMAHGLFEQLGSQRLVELMEPTALGYVVFFGGAMFLLGKRFVAIQKIQRSTRWSFWGIVWCGLAAWLWGMVFTFPQVTGALWIAAMAAAVQFAAPWQPPRDVQWVRR